MKPTCTTSNTQRTDRDEKANVAPEPTNYIAEAITEAFGERCPEYVEGCPCCEAWKRYDALVAPTLPADVKGQDEWHSPDEIPDTPKGTERNFIVAVRRARNGQVYSFPCAYLNAYPLRYEYECPKGDSCEGEGCEDGCPITGWYSATGDGEDGLTYSPMYMDPGDEFLGWRKVPQWPAASRLHHEMGGDRD